MYTSYIGKKFLKLYRERKNLPTGYTAGQFFDEELFPLFFDAEYHLMHVGNSPFFQKPTASDVAKHGSKTLAQYSNLKEKIESGIPSFAVYVGYAAEDNLATSSGQVTDLKINIDSEEMYASWIGQALAIGVSGGLAMFIDKPEILWTLYKGWKRYRTYLIQTPKLKDKQIETWNGHWLYYSLGKDVDETNLMAEFDPHPEVVLGKLAIPTIDWIKIIFSLSRKYSNQVITSYIYNLSQTNTTIGFVNLFLPQVRNLLKMKEEFFIKPENSSQSRDFEKLYTTYYNLKNASKLGAIGLRAIEPDRLRQFMPIGSMPFAQGKSISLRKEDDFFQYQIFKIWIMAMLNNKKELNELAGKLAQTLIDFEQSNKEKNRGKSTYERLSEQVKDSKNLRMFLDNLTEVMVKYEEAGENFKAVKDAVIELPPDLFPLFIALIRFEYQYQKSVKS